MAGFIKIKECIDTKRVMPCLQTHVFITFSFVCPSCVFSISSLYFIIHFIGTDIVKNKSYVFLNGFCFIGNAVLVSNNIHQGGVFRTMSRIYVWAVCKNSWCLLVADIFFTKAPRLMFHRVLNLSLIIMQWSTQNPLPKLFFWRITIKRKLWVMSSHF